MHYVQKNGKQLLSSFNIIYMLPSFVSLYTFVRDKRILCLKKWKLIKPYHIQVSLTIATYSPWISSSLDSLYAQGRVEVVPVVKLDDDHWDHYGTAAALPRKKTMESLICNLFTGFWVSMV
jgi:hypothetical protein